MPFSLIVARLSFFCSAFFVKDHPAFCKDPNDFISPGPAFEVPDAGLKFLSCNDALTKLKAAFGIKYDGDSQQCKNFDGNTKRFVDIIGAKCCGGAAKTFCPPTPAPSPAEKKAKEASDKARADLKKSNPNATPAELEAAGKKAFDASTAGSNSAALFTSPNVAAEEEAAKTGTCRGTGGVTV